MDIGGGCSWGPFTTTASALAQPVIGSKARIGSGNQVDLNPLSDSGGRTEWFALGLASGRDHERSDTTFNGADSKSLRQSFSGPLRGLFQP